MRYFLGVDVGGSKTHALVADETGQALGFAAGGGGNWQGVQYDGLRMVVEDVTARALEAAGLRPGQVSAAGFGIAGYDWPCELPEHLQALSGLGLECPLELTNDAVIALLAGAPEGWGVVLVAGTGNNCCGRDRQGREGRITGEGPMFGEYGGGSEIVYKAQVAVAHAWTHRGPATRLSDDFVRLAGASGVFDLLEGLYMERYRPDASWALAVFAAAADGDPVAWEVIDWSARELGESACAVIRQLDLQTDAFDLVLAGSVFAAGEMYIAPLSEVILRCAPQARLVRLGAPPVVGGVVLAMQAARDLTPLQAVYARLVESATRLARAGDSTLNL